MPNLLIRIIISDIDDAQAIDLKKTIKKQLELYPQARVELSLTEARPNLLTRKRRQ